MPKQKTVYMPDVYAEIFSKNHAGAAQNLRAHETHQIVDYSKDYICDRCNKSYKYMSNLKRHKNHECEKKYHYFCPICERAFSQKHSVERHMLCLHPQEYPLI